VTDQTGPAGREVKRVYVEEGCDVARELYLAALVDRRTSRVTIMAAPEGGVRIEELAATGPEMSQEKTAGRVFRLAVDPLAGLQPDQARRLAEDLGLEDAQAEAAAQAVGGVYQAFTGLDASLIEINPLAVTRAGAVVALDARMSFDDNALFRHRELEELRDPEEGDPSELEAARHEINYVRMDGNIGCIVSGAGLAMATVDILKLRGGEPADFMDIRPGATRGQVATAFKMMLADRRVTAILVNIIGGGIMRCDLIAEALVAAAREVGLRVPLVIRFAGTNADIGCKLVQNSGLAALFTDDMGEAAEQAVRVAKKEAA
jgi:succinyl-CoA synthetase beta subunit